MTDRDRPGAEPIYRTAETAQRLGLNTPELGKECAARVVSDLPRVRIVGPFEISASIANQRVERPHSLLPSDANNDVVALAAPSITTTAIGETKSMAGCVYRLRDNRLVFEKTSIFGGRIDVVRKKPDNT